jgi:RNA polymerase sigma-70 factor (ECF subfamily)
LYEGLNRSAKGAAPPKNTAVAMLDGTMRASSSNPDRNFSCFLPLSLCKTTPRGEFVKALRKEADERLLVEAAQKDPARFAELYENNFERVYAYVVRRVGDRTETEDLTSEVFHHALANLRRFEWRGIPFAAWLYRIAANLISDRWQRSNREQVADEPEQIESAAAKGNDFEEVERRATLFRLVDTLPAEQRRVVVLRFVEEKSIKEVAREIRKTEGAVKQLQFRALSSLRARMEGADA